ncbi:energy-coupled thiamine transporter ThiT [Clostridium botulinum]|uniref:Energy-coupled thiamine transporter ThiT n=1 Tax=Clostridium botulinum TaxID=1491 RepID=A0A6B4K1B2_CLOBO|nr:energy-coupled thiamine transporter ThiT [Clostridium botulinum]NFD85277.1 energy-coupled thiamine transporter ThiT [Clostridium botulinum]NFE09635.1 energy-coupled thiamine transporter ThiT [Clostridium botulinum]NFE33049.1 energy-coupled thiamine transporter ThiT [Clostridium botulinum]NFE47642.1 energy-coupled thiamine transporter ThiT [Clostridium botulinum]
MKSLEWGKRFSETFSGFSGKMAEILKSPLSILAIIAFLIIFIAVFKLKKIKLNPRIITQIGIALALSTILNIFRIYRFPQGGSVTLGCMVPILLLTFAYGKEIGFLTGFLYGLISLITDPFILHPIQMLFDYPLPYLAIGLAGYFRNNKTLSISFAFFIKFLCHFISGVVFFGSFAPEGIGPIIYSLSVNVPIIGAEAIICIVIFKLMPVHRLLKSINPKYSLVAQG